MSAAPNHKIENQISVDWEKWQPKEEGVLCFIRPTSDPEKILLIEKKRGLGAGKVNGPGGRIEPEESPLEAAIRETQEEVQLTPMNCHCRGILNFQFIDGYSLRCHVFLASEYMGEMKETDEAKPFWQNIQEIPYENMWADDIYWLPALLEGKKFQGNFVFDSDKMLYNHLSILDISS
ncbi:MAG: 8-oxo-dGTP diphosphatase [Verrucomicrobiota bacterium]